MTWGDGIFLLFFGVLFGVFIFDTFFKVNTDDDDKGGDKS